MNAILLAFASLFILAIRLTLAGANSVQSDHVYGVLERPKHTGGEGGIAPVAVTSGRLRVRVLRDAIVANVENIHVGVNEVASASPAEVLREDVIADDVDVIAVNVAIEPRSDREEVALTIGDDNMITNATDFDPSRGQFERIVASSRKLELTCTGGTKAFAATDGGKNHILYDALRNYAASGDAADTYGSPVNCWNVAAVTDFTALFFNMGDFNDDLSSWDTGQVTSMYQMFYGASIFNQDISSWKTGQVTSMYQMFMYASIFNQPVSSWKTGQVTSMYQTFYGANKFNQDISSWETGQVTSMELMFMYASIFNQPVSSWDTSKVTNMERMFYSASNFNQGISSWETGQVTAMQSMFMYASIFNQDISSWDTSKVTDMYRMFYRASNFNQGISSWETGQVTSMESMFEDAVNSDSNFNQDISSWDTSKVTSMQKMFYHASNFNQGISSWETGQVTSMQSMFQDAKKFNQPVSSWDTSKVTDMRSMFYRADVFNQELCSWGQNYNINTNYASIFLKSGCPSQSAPLSGSPWCSTTSQDTCGMPSTSPSKSPSSKPSTSPSAHPSTSPSKSPSAKPSTSPSAHPSTSPSESPSTKPSTSSRKSPSIPGSMDMWQIILTSLEANFTANSETELLLKYDIGKDATSDGSAVLLYTTKLYQKDCITELPTSGTGPLLFNLTDNGRITKSPANDTFDELRLMYNVNKTLIASSPVWNSTANQIEVCQEVHLIEDSAILGQMFVVKDQRDVIIEFDLDVNISLDIGLGEGTSVLASTATGVDNYITAYKCDENFEQDDSPLVPNEILSVCIESNSIDVEINEIETMTLIQGAANLPIIVNSLMSSPRITGNTIVSPIKQVVSTLVPFNLITFAKGQSMAVEGKVVMQLVESSARRLQNNFGTGSVKAAAFAVDVILQPKAALADGVELHSSASMASRAFILLGVALAFVVW